MCLYSCKFPVTPLSRHIYTYEWLSFEPIDETMTHSVTFTHYVTLRDPPISWCHKLNRPRSYQRQWRSETSHHTSHARVNPAFFQERINALVAEPAETQHSISTDKAKRRKKSLHEKMPKVRIVRRLRSDGDYRREKEEIINRLAREYEELSKKYTALLESLRTKHHPAVEGTETDDR